VGILAGNHWLITRNTANRNVDEGIATGSSCPVSFNTAHLNDTAVRAKLREDLRVAVAIEHPPRVPLPE
jgi:hypothetical protein